MDVFLIPTGTTSYELYYEARDETADQEPAGESPAASSGVFERWRARFAAMLRDAERQRQRHDEGETEEEAGFLHRMQRRSMRYVAERIAEQRLLWHLRSADRVTAHLPDDMTPAEAEQVIRRMLKGDADRHLRWLIVDLLLLAATTPLMLVPGPNIAAYYFIFNVVGHFLAMRGARRGLSGITWTLEPSAPLADLRQALTLDGAPRYRRVRDVADRLRLQHLARFFERIAIPTA